MNDAPDLGTTAAVGATCRTVTRCGVLWRFCGLAHFQASAAWAILWGQKRNAHMRTKYHGLAHRPDFVTFRHNRLATMERSELGEIVTILYGRPPTTKTAKITEIVTILHSPEIPGPVRMIIIITPTVAMDRENDNHNHSREGA